MEQISAYPGVLLRFREGKVSMTPCANPSHDLTEAQQQGDVDLFKLNHSTFCRNAQDIQNYFKLHPSTTSFLMTPTRRSAFRCREDYLTISLRYPVFDTASGVFLLYSTTLLLFPDRILLLEADGENSFFDPQLAELLAEADRPRTIAQLTNKMTDAVFRVYTDSLEDFGDVLNKLEGEIIDGDTKAVLAMTALVRKQNIFLQQTILPLKEMSFDMRHAESGVITPGIDATLHVLSDQIQRIIDSAGMLSQINSGLLDIYSNVQGNRMNEIMRTLTVFSVLTLPLTVLSGFYGMNFAFLPGIQWKFGVVAIVAAMAISVLLIWWYCRRKNII